MSILTDNRVLLDGAAADLLSKETLSGDELLSLAEKVAVAAALEKKPKLAVMPARA